MHQRLELTRWAHNTALPETPFQNDVKKFFINLILIY